MMDKIINDYISYLNDIKHLSPKSIKSYLPAIKEMFEYCDFKLLDDIENSDVIVLQGWLNKKKKEGLSSQSINRRIASCKSFYSFLVAKRYISFNASKELKAEKIESKGHSSDLKEIKKMRDFLKYQYEQKSNFMNLRNMLICDILWNCGLRNFELRSLNTDTINPITGEFTVNQKGGSIKSCVLNDSTLNLYNKYLHEREKIQAKDNALFISSYKSRMSSKGLEKMINTICDKMGIEHKRVHQFRHDACNVLIESGVELEKVSKILGHSTPNITYKIYYSQSTDNKKKIVNENPIFK